MAIVILLITPLITKPWAYNPQNSRIHIKNPNNDPGFLNQVPTLPMNLQVVFSLNFQFDCAPGIDSCHEPQQQARNLKCRMPSLTIRGLNH